MPAFMTAKGLKALLKNVPNTKLVILLKGERVFIGDSPTSAKSGIDFHDERMVSFPQSIDLTAETQTHASSPTLNKPKD